MPNYGFAIDLRKCIGCHACTIACKAEHEIPIGVNRCWVKTVEKGTFPDTRALLLSRALQSVRRRAVRADLSDQRALQAPRRHRRSARRPLHRLPRLHGGVPVRSAVHRSEHAHRREMQLLREPRRERAAAGVRERVPDRMPHLRRPRRSRQRGRADRPAGGDHRAQAREGHRTASLLHRRRRERDPAGGVGRGRSITRKARCCCARWVADAGSGSAGRRRASTTTCRTRSRGASTWSLYLFMKAVATGAMLRRGHALAAWRSAGRSSSSLRRRSRWCSSR